MVGAVLRVGVFEQKSGALNAVVVRLKGLDAAGPGEADLGQSAFSILAQSSLATTARWRLMYS